ncbi:MAG TPA: DUF5683 domain-containing protein [Candidatus Krumholzibacteria bacterium]|nr:DUF5683 domain-containing protein [Candidatus Krumholzibacteria bacterium]
MRIPRIVAVVISVLVAGAGTSTRVARAAQAPADSVAADSSATPVTASPAPDSLRAIVVHDSLGIPGTLKGEAVPDPAEVKAMLRRMGSSEVEGRTQWERKKNPRVAMLCSALLPGLGQTYNGRRLKVGVMVGFTSFYFGSAWNNYKRYEASIQRRDTFQPGTTPYVNENERAEFWKAEARTYVWWSGAVWIIGLLDSWIDAHLYDVREYTPPARAETSGLPTIGAPTSYVTIGFDLYFAK